jgi:hypothetical protein
MTLFIYILKPVDFAHFSKKAVPLLLEKGLEQEDID